MYIDADFEELRKRFVEQKVIDHDLLYSKEKSIMQHALVKIVPNQKDSFFVFRGSWSLIKTGF